MKGANHKGPHAVGFHVYGMSRIGKFVEIERLVIVLGWGGRRRGGWRLGGVAKGLDSK